MMELSNLATGLILVNGASRGRFQDTWQCVTHWQPSICFQAQAASRQLSRWNIVSSATSRTYQMIFAKFTENKRAYGLFRKCGEETTSKTTCWHSKPVQRIRTAFVTEKWPKIRLDCIVLVCVDTTEASVLLLVPIACHVVLVSRIESLTETGTGTSVLRRVRAGLTGNDWACHVECISAYNLSHTFWYLLRYIESTKTKWGWTTLFRQSSEDSYPIVTVFSRGVRRSNFRWSFRMRINNN